MKKLLFLSLLLLSLFSQAQDSTSKEYNLTIGGAIRANYFVKTWDELNKKKGGELAYDMFRLNVDANYNNVIASAEIRFYSQAYGGILIHHAYMGYQFNECSQLQLGIHQVPFGIQPYASNDWFFNIDYYIGYEDDYDMGLKYIYQKDKWGFAAAFYKNSELPPDNFSRFSYDVSDTQNEVNQGNIKVSYNIFSTEFGVSLQAGQLEEVSTGDMGTQSAAALHTHSTFGRFNIKLQATYFNMDPKGAVKDYVVVSGYGSTYQMSTEAFVYTIGVKYSLPLELGPIEGIDFYNDFGIMDKQRTGQYNSLMNVLGAGVNMGKMYTYIDFACGKNHSWLGPNYTTAFSNGDPNADWHMRFNMNFGYYF